MSSLSRMGCLVLHAPAEAGTLLSIHGTHRVVGKIRISAVSRDPFDNGCPKPPKPYQVKVI